MKWLRYSIAVKLLVLCAASAHAGSDPIGWSLSGNLPAQTTVNEFYSGYTYTIINNMPFTMPSPLYISKSVNGEFTVTDNCSGKKLGSHQTCTVSFTFAPVTDGAKSLGIALEYDSNIVHLPTIVTTTGTSSTPLITGTVTTPLPLTVGTGTSNNVAFSFKNNGNGTVTGVSYSPGYPAGFNETTNTCHIMTTFSPGASCMVMGTLVPATATSYTVSAALNYTGGPTALSTTTTASQQVTGSVSTPFPANINIGLPTTPVTFTFTNTGSAAVIGVNAPTVTPSGGTYDYTTSNCSGTLAAGTSCIITGNFTAPSTGDYTINATFNYAGPAVPLSTNTDATGRLFTIINNCSTEVWFSFNGSAIASSPSCPTTSCPTGSQCDMSNNTCYWSNPVPTSASLNLQPGAQTSLILPDANTATTTVWAGSIAAQTQCDGSTSCATANCQSSGGSTSCSPGVPFTQPATVGQFTLIRNANDTYSVNIAGGVNVGLSIDPLSTKTPSAYTCGNPGSPTPNNLKLTTLGACSWTSLSTGAPNVDYVWVQALPSPTTCTDNTDCTAPQICGLSYSTTQSPTFQQTCGPQLGYWSANTACSLNATDANTYFSCNTPLTSGTLTDLYACNSPPLTGSCYALDAVGTCCGCQNWNLAPTSLPVPAGPTTQQCVASNSDWTTYALPTVTWLKTACPTALVYPDDTASSTFTCNSAAPATTNATSYTITFCPT